MVPVSSPPVLGAVNLDPAVERPQGAFRLMLDMPQLGIVGSGSPITRLNAAKHGAGRALEVEVGFNWQVSKQDIRVDLRIHS